MMRLLARALIAVLLFCSASPLFADEPIVTASLLNLSIEELANVKVISVAKKEQSLSDAPASIYVITQDDIRRSGVTSLPEALRLAPGVEVARATAALWAVTIHGFNGNFASTVLVLIDGRSVYSPLFVGAQWDSQDTFLQDIDRIEVIRGPGASLWGANAVNGVINIITKHARDTQGGLVYGGGGNEEKGFGGVREGVKTGENTYISTFAKYFFRDGSKGAPPLFSKVDAPDSLQMARGGMRMDTELPNGDTVTLHGEIYKGKTAPRYEAFIPDLEERLAQITSNYETFPQTDLAGGHVMTVWKRPVSVSSDMQLQLYYDDLIMKDPTWAWQKLETVDLDFQHRFEATERQELTWGLGYRVNFSKLTKVRFPTTGPIVALSLEFNPARQTDELFSGFLLDDITLSVDELHLIIGTKFEHNDYSGYEIQPNARVLWTPNKRNTLWAAVSRAVRTPSWAVRNLEAYGTAGPGITTHGNKDFKSMTVLAYEAGYRVRPLDRLFFDASVFYNVYDDIGVAETTSPTDKMFTNKMKGSTYGTDLAITWSVADWWRLETSYSLLRMFLHPDASLSTADAAAAKNFAGASPENQASFKSAMDLPADTELDLWLRYIDHLVGPPRIHSYVNFDARAAWKPVEDLELAVTGQSLLKKLHQEIPSGLEMQRGVYGVATWKF